MKAQFEANQKPFDSSAALFENGNKTNINEGANSSLTNDETFTDGHDCVVLCDTEIRTPPSSSNVAAPSYSNIKRKRKSHSWETVSESILSSKKARNSIEEELASRKMTILDEELASKRKELEIKEIQHYMKCEILDIEKKIKLKEYEIKELEYKIKLKQFQSM